MSGSLITDTRYLLVLLGTGYAMHCEEAYEYAYDEHYHVSQRSAITPASAAARLMVRWPGKQTSSCWSPLPAVVLVRGHWLSMINCIMNPLNYPAILTALWMIFSNYR